MEGSMKVKTTSKTFDPYAIIKARDIIKCIARSVPYQIALTLIQDEIYCDIIKIKSLVRDKERFVKRRNRLVGPNGETLKALEILLECYILVQGSTVTVIGNFKKLKVARRVIEDIMKNIHPVYHIKELMIKKELEKDEKLKNENWSRFLPEFKKIKDNHKKKKKAIVKGKKQVKKERHAPSIQPRKEDIEMETGKYFLTQDDQKMKARNEKIKQQKIKKNEKMIERKKQYDEPLDEKTVADKKKFGMDNMKFNL